MYVTEVIHEFESEKTQKVYAGQFQGYAETYEDAVICTFIHWVDILRQVGYHVPEPIRLPPAYARRPDTSPAD